MPGFFLVGAGVGLTPGVDAGRVLVGRGVCCAGVGRGLVSVDTGVGSTVTSVFVFVFESSVTSLFEFEFVSESDSNVGDGVGSMLISGEGVGSTFAAPA